MSGLSSHMGTIIAEYAEVEQQLEELEDKKKALREKVLEVMRAEDIDKIQSQYGNLTLERRKLWQYSPAVDSLSDTLKNLQKEEQAKGVATYKEQEVLKFRRNK